MMWGGLFMQSLSQSRPTTFRAHDWADSRFIPDVFRQYTISDAGKMVIQSTDGTTKITLSPDTVEINAPHVTVNGGDLTVNVPATFTAPVVMTNGLEVDGITIESHIHGGVQPGTGDSECRTTVTTLSSYIESASSCEDWTPVLRGDSTLSCIVFNTEFFEGIPTLDRYGLALAIALLLLTGLVTVRRF